MAVQNDFSKGSILSHMARIALPMTLAQFVNILYNIIDRVFIGRIPDHATEALTGLGVAFPICSAGNGDFAVCSSLLDTQVSCREKGDNSVRQKLFKIKNRPCQKDSCAWLIRFYHVCDEQSRADGM